MPQHRVQGLALGGQTPGAALDVAAHRAEDRAKEPRHVARTVPEDPAGLSGVRGFRTRLPLRVVLGLLRVGKPRRLLEARRIRLVKDECSLHVLLKAAHRHPTGVDPGPLVCTAIASSGTRCGPEPRRAAHRGRPLGAAALSAPRAPAAGERAPCAARSRATRARTHPSRRSRPYGVAAPLRCAAAAGPSPPPVAARALPRGAGAGRARTHRCARPPPRVAGPRAPPRRSPPCSPRPGAPPRPPAARADVRATTWPARRACSGAVRSRVPPRSLPLRQSRRRIREPPHPPRAPRGRAPAPSSRAQRRPRAPRHRRATRQRRRAFVQVSSPSTSAASICGSPASAASTRARSCSERAECPARSTA